MFHCCNNFYTFVGELYNNETLISKDNEPLYNKRPYRQSQDNGS